MGMQQIQSIKATKMQNAGVKDGEKHYLPGLPVCLFCKQIARSNKNGSKIENQGIC